MVTSYKVDNIGAVLFGKARRSILSLLYGHPDDRYYLRQIVRMTGIGLGPAQRELKTLTETGIILRLKEGPLVYYRANQDSPVFAELRNIVRKTFGLTDIIRESLSPLSKAIKIAFIFGSVARGSEGKASDIDLMVIGETSFSDVSSAISSAEKAIQREINPVVYPVAEFRQKIKSGHHFLKSVLAGEKIFLIGTEDELKRLAE
jgi:uncharacterized protein